MWLYKGEEQKVLERLMVVAMVVEEVVVVLSFLCLIQNDDGSDL